jgi:hypothetical protein
MSDGSRRRRQGRVAPLTEPNHRQIVAAAGRRSVPEALRLAASVGLLGIAEYLEPVLCQYLRRYNPARPHRGVQLAVPEPCSEPGQAGTVRRHDVLGGITHEHQRAA